MFKCGIHTIIFTYKAALILGNQDSIKNLSENFCIVDEKKAENFVKSIRQTNKKMNNFSDLMAELEIPDFYNKNFSEFDGFIRSIID